MQSMKLECEILNSLELVKRSSLESAVGKALVVQWLHPVCILTRVVELEQVVHLLLSSSIRDKTKLRMLKLLTLDD